MIVVAFVGRLPYRKEVAFQTHPFGFCNIKVTNLANDCEHGNTIINQFFGSNDFKISLYI